MKCVICKLGETAPNVASFTVEKEGSFLIFANVPADVCTNCGEAYFSAETTKMLYEKADEDFKKGVQVEIVKLAS